MQATLSAFIMTMTERLPSSFNARRSGNVRLNLGIETGIVLMLVRVLRMHSSSEPLFVVVGIHFEGGAYG